MELIMAIADLVANVVCAVVWTCNKLMQHKV